MKIFLVLSSSWFHSWIPVETCEEIKASEDGKAKSGEYWIYSIITGKTALVSCDMEPEGKNIQVLVVAADMNVKKFV